LLESGERSEDGSTDPNGVFSFRGSDDLDLHGGRGEGSQFLLESIGDAREHGSTTRADDITIEVFSDVDVAFHDRVVSGFVDTSGFHTQERGLEEGFRATETFVSDGDDLAVREFVALLEGGRRGSGLHFLFEVEGNISELFLDITDDFSLSSGGERVATFGEDLHQVISEVTSCEIEAEDSVGEGISFVDGHGVSDTISGVENDSSGTA